MSRSDIEIDQALCAALGKRAGESLLDAAERVANSENRGVRTASAILRTNPSGDVWLTMRSAYAALGATCRLREVKRCRLCRGTPGKRYPAVRGDLCVIHAIRQERAVRGEP